MKHWGWKIKFKQGRGGKMIQRRKGRPLNKNEEELQNFARQFIKPIKKLEGTSDK